MKTIKQIADELGVSKQAVYDKIKKEPLSSALKNLTVKLDNTLHVKLDGVKLIKSTFNKEPLSSVSSETSKALDSALHLVIDNLQKQIDTLTKQLETKDQQISDLIDVNKNLSKSINVVHHNQLAETMIEGQQEKLAFEASPKTSFLNRFFKGKK
jgi:predicted transcriptional regulator